MRDGLSALLRLPVPEHQLRLPGARQAALTPTQVRTDPEGDLPMSQHETDPRRVVWELDDLLSIVETAKHVEQHVSEFGVLGDKGEPLPLRVSVGDALREVWAAHIVVDPARDTFVDFEPQERTDR